MTYKQQFSPLNLALVLFVIVSVFTVVVIAVARWLGLTGSSLRRWTEPPGPEARDHREPPQ